MTDTGYYIVAEHLFGVEADESMLALMTNYAPFKVGQSDNQDVLFYVSIVQGEPVSYVEEWRQDEEGQDTICGHTEDGNPVFEFRFGGKTAGWLVCTPGYRNGILHLSGFHSKAALDDALMILFAMASACLGTVLFHSAVVSLDGRGYMFLGKSGTGKSTHARLWLQNIPGTELMNDDNPAVRVKPDGTAVVYGTPWSGKTPCYRKVEAVIGGIVRLEQAPKNEVQKIAGIKAYANVIASAASIRWRKDIMDALSKTAEAVVTLSPCWHLKCLPDADAALTCKQAVTA